MNQLLKQPAAVLSLCLIFILGICLLVVSVWLRPYHQALDSLAYWCMRFSPLISLSLPDGIVIDTTGCAHLFGGEKVGKMVE